MSIDCEQEIIKLGQTCVQINTELSGMQDLMRDLTINQTTLIKLSERSLYIEEKQARAEKALGKFYDRLRCLEECRLSERIGDIETSQRWGRGIFIVSMLSIFTGSVIAWIKFVVFPTTGGS